MLVLTDTWTALRPHRRPYRWLGTAPGQLYPQQAAEELAACFPTEAYVRRDSGTRTDGKRYRNYSRRLAGPDGGDPEGLPRLWRLLLTDLLDPRYRRDVARVLDQPVADAVEVRLVRHAQGDWLGPHTDRPDKIFSHIFYFNPGWRASWGGCLQILGSSDPTDIVDQVVPRLGASALLARADNSWHQVSAVAAEPVPERASLLVHGLRLP